MRINRGNARRHLESGEIGRLFVDELGWDRASGAYPVVLDGLTVNARSIAEKRGFRAFVVETPASIGVIPIAARRLVRDRLATHARENLIVFMSADRSNQIWQWTRREIGKPIALREHVYMVGQSGEALLQRLDHLVVGLDEEEGLTILDVANRARLAFDSDRPSRRFYDRFTSEHEAFLRQIRGISGEANRSWYASIILNRLMFVYFIQQKGFLDGDRRYLRSRLEMVQREQGPNQFHRFYRHFLLRLFFDGLGRREDERPQDIRVLIGDVPYLNGGMFIPHALEEGNEIAIPDAAFESILSFFEEFTWHLDDRPVAQDNEINPDVLGYIFERYINQKAKGAYYTKEDVTEYIARSTVVPRILDMVQRQVPNAFQGEASVWRHLRADPTRYILPSMKVGEDADLPEELIIDAAGVITATDDSAAFEASAPHALPRETWMAVADRRRRLNEIHEDLTAGRVRSSDTLVSLNLDLRQFAQDVVERADDPSLLDAFHRALKSISVLDPTCGSGAFLFAVLNVLEPIYEAVLDRMQAFADDAARTGWTWNQDVRDRFDAALTEANGHRNRKYFIYRTIVVNNLFGVDIMDEAVEICKLRLFLKLASQLEERDQIEPLPDIDFNVRAGNALVGYTQRPSQAAVGLDLTQTRDTLEDQARMLDGLFARYRETQFGDRREAAALKADIVTRIATLDDTLNRSLGERYSARTATQLRDWKASHQPFHWWAAFYDRMNLGGFDVIVGNPPYIESAKVRREYTVLDIETERASDIYAWVMERSTQLLAPGGRSGMIVPLSLTFSSRFTTLRTVLGREYAANWYSSFGRIPSALFNYDVRVRNTIHLGRKRIAGEADTENLSGRLHRWFEEERPFLFETLAFTPFTPAMWDGLVPKVHTPGLISLFEGARRTRTPTIETMTRSSATAHSLYFKKSAYNWLNFCVDMPPCYDRNGALIPHTEFGQVHFNSREERDLAFLLLNGKWQFANWYMVGDDFHVTIGMFEGLPMAISRLSPQQRRTALALVPELNRAMEQAISFKLNAGKRVGNYNLARCRHVTDISDRIFGEAFGWMDAWPEIELLYAQAVKTTYADLEDDE